MLSQRALLRLTGRVTGILQQMLIVFSRGETPKKKDEYAKHLKNDESETIEMINVLIEIFEMKDVVQILTCIVLLLRSQY